MTSKEAWLCFSSLQCCSLQTADWHWCVGLSTHDIMAFISTKKKKTPEIPHNRRDTNLNYEHCGLEMMSSGVSRCSQREIYLTRVCVTEINSTLGLQLDISKDKQVKIKNDGADWQTRKVKMMLMMLTSFIISAYSSYIQIHSRHFRLGVKQTFPNNINKEEKELKSSQMNNSGHLSRGQKASITDSHSNRFPF